MNNKIKEILDYLKEFIDEDRLEQINLNRLFVSSLLDYITNLEATVNNLTNSLNKKVEEGINLQIRTDKAIEYIENHSIYEKDYSYFQKAIPTELIDILRGEDNG